MNKLYHIPFLFCICLIIGAGVGSWFSVINQTMVLTIFIGSALFALLFFLRKEPIYILAGFSLIGILLGGFLSNQASIRLGQIRQIENTSKQVNVKAMVVSEKDEREKYNNYIIESNKERILLLTDKYNDFSYGDTLEIKGAQEVPKNFADFDYQGYLAKDGIYAMMRFPEVSLIGRDTSPLVNFFRGLFNIKAQIRYNLVKNFPQNESDFIRALILGDKGTVSQDLRTAFSRTGTSHVISISGLHLSIMTVFMFNIFLVLGFWRKHATIATIFMLFLFLIFIGPIAPLVRSVIMSILFLISMSSGKVFRSTRIITYAAIIMLILNPLLLRYDVGFELSYLALLGIMLFKPMFDYFLKKLSIPKIINDMITTTLSAQILTLPIIISNFKIISLVAPIVNPLVLFLFPVLLNLSFLWAFLSLLFNVSFLAILLYPITNLTLWIVKWFGDLSFSAKQLSNTSSLFYFSIIYLFFSLAILFWWKNFYARNLTPLAEWRKWKDHEE
ncbi:MAG: ComEC/Rec2 family competence protein [Candidatus Paceibacterota bacterium]|jgi:competence protein ComEC